MAAAPKRSPLFLPVTIILAALGGALIGGTFFAGLFFLDDPGSVMEQPVQVVAVPLMVAGVSLLFVLPATLLFGLPVALIVERRVPGRWSALALCLAGAAIAQALAHGLVLSNAHSTATDYVFSTPFALGAALVLWWRLTRAA